MRPDPLLEAIFQPAEEGLRGALVAARRRRKRRVLVRGLAGAACLTLALALLRLPSAPTRLIVLPPAPSRPVVEEVTSRALIPREIVHTTRTSVSVLSTSEAGTAPRRIADAELLAAFQEGRAALVGASNERRLVEF